MGSLFLLTDTDDTVLIDSMSTSLFIIIAHCYFYEWVCELYCYFVIYRALTVPKQR